MKINAKSSKEIEYTVDERIVEKCDEVVMKVRGKNGMSPLQGTCRLQ